MGSVLCEHCTAICCHYVAMQIDTPTTARDLDDIRWYVLHEDMIVFVEEGEWYLQINRKCRHLQPDRRCGIYETRPQICREYKTNDCDYHGGDYGYDHLFTEPEHVEAYAKEFLRDKGRKTKKRTRSTPRKPGTTRVLRPRRPDRETAT